MRNNVNNSATSSVVGVCMYSAGYMCKNDRASFDFEDAMKLRRDVPACACPPFFLKPAALISARRDGPSLISQYKSPVPPRALLAQIRHKSGRLAVGSNGQIRKTTPFCFHSAVPPQQSPSQLL